MSSTASLFEPLRLGPITLRNRVCMSALTRNRCVPTNVPNDLVVEYYRQRAESAGLIISEGVLIVQQGTEWQHAPGIWSGEQVAAWKKVTDAVHAEGSYIYAQLWHLGRISHPDASEQIASGQPVYAPSAVSARGGKFRFLPGQPGYVTPTEIDDPMKLVALFKQAAINAKEAGFDGVELHGANGYLVHEFLDNTSNFRTDKWGGSVENRCRFGLEALKVLIDVFGADRVGLKISPAGGYNDIGMTLEDTLQTFSYFVTEADKFGLAYIAIQRYTDFLDITIDGKLRSTKHDVITSYAPLIKNSLVFANAQFTPEEAAKYISEGKVAGVFFGFLWIAHPDLAKRIQYGKPLDGVLDMLTLYGPRDGNTELEAQIKGYTDYPPAVYP